jgi:uroporphyrinogen-III synthase
MKGAMKSVLNTRPRGQAETLSALLREARYAPVEIPLVELALMPEALAALPAQGRDCDAFLLSSPSLLSWLEGRLTESARVRLASKPWFLISAGARAQVEALGGRVAFAPKRPSLTGFLAELPPREGLRLLHLCSAETRLDPAIFARRGLTVRNWPLYAPRLPDGAAARLQAAWPEAGAVLFASGSAVRNLFAADPQLGRTLGAEGPAAVTIGPSASEALDAAGIAGYRQAPTADNAGLMAALAAVFPPPAQEKP